MRQKRPIEQCSSLDEFLSQWLEEEIHVVGIAGQEPRAILAYLLSRGITPHAHEIVEEKEFLAQAQRFSDAEDPEQVRSFFQQSLQLGPRLHLGTRYLSGISESSLVIVAQSFRRYKHNHLLVHLSRGDHPGVVQAIEIAFKIARCPIIGVTGTLGKSTVTNLIGHILRNGGVEVYESGNDRQQPWNLERLQRTPSSGIAVFELSNRHLMDLRQSPNIAVLTNVYPHHLDEHGDFPSYVSTKQNVFLYQTGADLLVCSRSLRSEGVVAPEELKSKTYFYGLERDADTSAYISGDDLVVLDEDNSEMTVCRIRDLWSAAPHNLCNALGAALTAKCLGLQATTIGDAIRSFKGLKYRQEYLGIVRGRKVYNDAKSSDPMSTCAAVSSGINPDVLILGGVREGAHVGDFRTLVKTVTSQRVRSIIAYGESREIIRADFEASHYRGKLRIYERLEDGIQAAFKLSAPGDTILFSPGCQSFDQFRDYRSRASLFECEIQKQKAWDKSEWRNAVPTIKGEFGGSVSQERQKQGEELSRLIQSFLEERGIAYSLTIRSLIFSMEEESWHVLFESSSGSKLTRFKLSQVEEDIDGDQLSPREQRELMADLSQLLSTS